MSTITTFTVEGDATHGFPTVADLELVMAECGVEEALPSDMDGSLSEQGPVENQSLTAQWWDTRWSIDGLEAVAATISGLHPDLLVTIHEEWDTRDADEPGSGGSRYQAGKLVARGVQSFHWVPVA